MSGELVWLLIDYGIAMAFLVLVLIAIGFINKEGER